MNRVLKAGKLARVFQTGKLCECCLRLDSVFQLSSVFALISKVVCLSDHDPTAQSAEIGRGFEAWRGK